MVEQAYRYIPAWGGSVTRGVVDGVAGPDDWTGGHSNHSLG